MTPPRRHCSRSCNRSLASSFRRPLRLDRLNRLRLLTGEPKRRQLQIVVRMNVHGRLLLCVAPC